MALKDAVIRDYQHHIEAYEIAKDRDDRHLPAAAYHEGIRYIITRDEDVLSAGLEVRGFTVLHPDPWLCALLEEEPLLVLASLRKVKKRRQNPHQTISQLCETLARAGVPVFAECLLALLGAEEDDALRP